MVQLLKSSTISCSLFTSLFTSESPAGWLPSPHHDQYDAHIRCRYIFSPTIKGHISYPAACDSLAACVVTYLCHEHHDPELDEEDIRAYLLSGAYKLHNFATQFLYPFVKQCFDQKDQGKTSEELWRCLGLLCDLRRSPDFSTEEQVDKSTARETTIARYLRDEWPYVARFILDLKRFQEQSSRQLYSLSNGTTTTAFQPFPQGSYSVSNSYQRRDGSISIRSQFPAQQLPYTTPLIACRAAQTNTFQTASATTSLESTAVDHILAPS